MKIIYKFIRVIFILLVTMLYGTVSVVAQDSRKVDVKIYFHYDEAFIDPDYMGNEKTLAMVDSLLTDPDYLSTLRKIEIQAQSSPEGSVPYNARLSERRRVSLENYFTAKYPDIDSALWSFTAVAENWELFHSDLNSDTELPSRDKILAISSSSKWKADEKEWLLRTLDGGKPWSYIRENILPSHRFGASVLFIPMAQPVFSIPQQLVEQRVESAVPSVPVEMTTPLLINDHKNKFLIGIKTNLVLDAVSVINIGVEVPIGDRFSVVAEIVHPWWRDWASNFTMQIESYHAELKYWLGDRTNKEQLQGWSVGLYGGWGRYDIQPFTVEGVQGEFYDIGAEVGYALPLSNSFNLEFSLGLGYVSTEWNDYYIARGTDEYGDIKVIPYPWMVNKMNAVLPTRGGVSLVWTIKGKGGSR